MKRRLSAEAQMANRMEYALENREFVVYLQPKVALRDGRMVGAGGAGALAAAGREHYPARRVHPLLPSATASSPASTSTCSTGCLSG